MFKLAEGFQFTEGPVWVRDGRLRCSSAIRTQHDLSVHEGWRAIGVSHAERICRRRHRGVRATGVERSDTGSARSADDQPTRQSSRDRASKTTVRLTVLADRYRGQTAQQPERSGLPLGRHAVFHRSAVRLAEVLRRSAQGTAVQRRLSLKEGKLRCSDEISPARTA